MGTLTYRNTKAAKLTFEDVRQIRRRYRDGATQGRLAAQFGISVVQIGRIVRGEVWNNVPPAEVTDEEMHTAQLRLMNLQRSLQGLTPFASWSEMVANPTVDAMEEAIAAERERRGAGQRMLEEAAGAEVSTTAQERAGALGVRLPERKAPPEDYSPVPPSPLDE